MAAVGGPTAGGGARVAGGRGRSSVASGLAPCWVRRPAASGRLLLSAPPPCTCYSPSPSLATTSSARLPPQARAGSKLGWSRAAWKPCQTEPVQPAGARRVSVHSRKPSQAAIDRVPEVLEFLQGLGFEREEAAQIERKGQLSLSLVSTLEERVAALESLTFGKEELKLLISRRPQAILHCPPGTIRASVSNLQDLFGLTPSQVKGSLIKNPSSMASLDSLGEAVQYLLDLGLTQAQVGQIFIRSPRALQYFRFNRRLEELEALQELGFSKQEVAAAILKLPRLLGTRVARNYCQLVDAMDERFGVDAETCRRLVLAHPTYLALTTATVVEKVDYLVKGMGRNAMELLECPAYVTYSLEKRIRPRYTACTREGMAHLRLSTMLNCSDVLFEESMQKRRERNAARKI